jgi:membrane associated rhomboid family serine protease
LQLTAPVATFLLAAIVGPSLYALYANPAWRERNLFRPHWFVPRRQWATAVTSGFLHADLPHLLFNGFTFWSFAFGLERAMGSGKFAALYAFGLLASTAGTWWQHRQDRGYASLGASGAILAVLFASIVYTPTSAIYILPIPVPIPAPVFAVLYLAFSVYAARQARGRVNHDAHIAGAVAGVVFVAAVDPAALWAAGRFAAALGASWLEGVSRWL